MGAIDRIEELRLLESRAQEHAQLAAWYAAELARLRPELEGTRRKVVAGGGPVLAEIEAIAETAIGARAMALLDAADEGFPMPSVLSCEVRETMSRLRELLARA